MKKNKLFKILCLLLFIVTGFVFADEEKKALPSKGEVVLVFSLKGDVWRQKLEIL